jgi:hypothetical protein
MDIAPEDQVRRSRVNRILTGHSAAPQVMRYKATTGPPWDYLSNMFKLLDFD